MTDKNSIAMPALLHIADAGGFRYGANQSWYPTEWQRNAGCGPTTCAHLVWYLSQTQAQCQPLCTEGTANRHDFVSLMETIWQYVTPGNMGVHTPALFVKGAMRYGEEQGVPLAANVLTVPLRAKARPSLEVVQAFLASSFENNLPVAFLNLSNGALQNLDDWHWVTLIAQDEKGSACMYDQGCSRWIDLALWLKSTTLGGGFVSLRPASLLTEPQAAKTKTGRFIFSTMEGQHAVIQ